MPIQEQHAKQADHNFNAAKYIVDNSDDFFDWSATMAFYSAVHFVESVLSFLFVSKTNLKYFENVVSIEHSNDLQGDEKYPSHSGKPLYSPHKIRKELIEKNFVNISGSYTLLDDASWTQRYTNWKQNDKGKCNRLITKHLLKIKEWHDSLVLADSSNFP